VLDFVSLTVSCHSKGAIIVNYERAGAVQLKSINLRRIRAFTHRGDDDYTESLKVGPRPWLLGVG